MPVRPSIPSHLLTTISVNDLIAPHLPTEEASEDQAS